MIPLTQGESLAVRFAIFMPPSRKKEGSVLGTKFPSSEYKTFGVGKCKMRYLINYRKKRSA